MEKESNGCADAAQKAIIHLKIIFCFHRTQPGRQNRRAPAASQKTNRIFGHFEIECKFPSNED